MKQTKDDIEDAFTWFMEKEIVRADMGIKYDFTEKITEILESAAAFAKLLLYYLSNVVSVRS